jgi:hypothetical protein
MVESNDLGTFQAKNGQQASRLKPAPQKLRALIGKINILPPEVPLMSFSDALLLAESESGETTSFGKAKIALSLCLNGLAEEDCPTQVLRDYIIGLPDSKHLDPISALDHAVSRYVNFREARLKLCGVANVNRLRLGKLGDFENFLESLGAGTRTHIDEEGRVRFIKDWFGEAVDGAEAARIRQCGVCRRVFWAGRKDQSGCNPRHADILRKRKKRERDSEQKLDNKARRIGNEAYKDRLASLHTRRQVDSAR